MCNDRRLQRKQRAGKVQEEISSGGGEPTCSQSNTTDNAVSDAGAHSSTEACKNCSAGACANTAGLIGYKGDTCVGDEHPGGGTKAAAVAHKGCGNGEHQSAGYTAY